MRRSYLPVAILAVVFAQSVLACPLQISKTLRSSGNSYDVHWPAEPGAIQYTVYQRRDDQDGWEYIKTVEADGEPPRFVVSPSSSRVATYRHMIIAEMPDGRACVGTTEFELPGDKTLAQISHKRVVLLAGSVRGANGSDFRTSLRLGNITGTKGRIYFRPVGTTPSAADPSIRYEFGNDSAAPDLYWPDVMAAMGATGIGTLEIIPDTRPEWDVIPVPNTNAHIYNVTPQGTFGSRVPAILPAEWLREEFPHTRWITIPAQQGNYRRNAGFRTLTEVRYTVRVTEPGQKTPNLPVLTVPANTTVFGSLDDLAGFPVSNAAQVTIHFRSGHAIGFYTYTENSTNDPTLVVGDPHESIDVAFGY